MKLQLDIVGDVNNFIAPSETKGDPIHETSLESQLLELDEEQY